MCLRFFCLLICGFLIMKSFKCESNIITWKYSPEERRQNILYDQYEEPENLKIHGEPRCANGLTYCESISNYPYQHLEEIVNSNYINLELFENEDVVLSYRTFGDNAVCESTQVTVVPVAAKNIHNEWKYILNNVRGSRFKQEVEIEECKLTKNINVCGLEVPGRYTTRCKQRYLYRSLLSFSEDGRVSYDVFKLPSACGCTYTLKSFLGTYSKKKRKGKKSKKQ